MHILSDYIPIESNSASGVRSLTCFDFIDTQGKGLKVSMSYAFSSK